MANNTTTEPFNPRTQVFSILGPDGVTEIPVSVPEVDALIFAAGTAQVNYGSQIGATFIMLIVVLTMTPKKRFRRVPTLVSIAGLVFNLIRCVLLSLYFTSSWVEFYTFMAHDISGVAQHDFNITVVATVFNIPVLILIEWALAIQAWSMTKLWSPPYKWAAVTVSAGLVVAAVGFKFASAVLQSLGAISDIDLTNVLWVRKADLVLSMTSITWFCFLFVIRLLMHMWMHRTILPPVKGLSAMEVLVMTNGILMLVPVLFAGLEFSSLSRVEFGSLTYTSVILVLPLGTLVAQRLANPSAFATLANSAHSNSASSRAPFLQGWQSNGGQPNGVTSNVVSHGTREKGRHYGDLEAGVRVDREVEHREERISEAS